MTKKANGNYGQKGVILEEEVWSVEAKDDIYFFAATFFFGATAFFVAVLAAALAGIGIS